MKICIIGKNSYIGNHIDEWLTRHGHEVYQLDVLNQDWETFNYSLYDVVIQVAGIVHRPDCTDAVAIQACQYRYACQNCPIVQEKILPLIKPSYF